jgi:hypothetical protein
MHGPISGCGSIGLILVLIPTLILAGVPRSQRTGYCTDPSGSNRVNKRQHRLASVAAFVVKGMGPTFSKIAAAACFGGFSFFRSLG